MPLRLALVVLGGALLVLVGSARAQTTPRQDRSFSPQLFHPAPGPDHFVTVEPAAPLRHLSLGVGLSFNYARNALSILSFNTVTMEAGSARANLIAHMLGAEAWVGLGLINRLQLAISIPMTLYQTGENFDSANPPPTGTHVKAADGFAFGDPRLYLKARLYGKDLGFQIALSHWLSFPFGDDTDFGGEKHFTGFAGEGRLLAGYDHERFRIGVFLGFNWRARYERFFSTTLGQHLTFGGAVAYDVVARRFSIIAEVYGRSGEISDITSINAGPLELDIAGKVWVIQGLSLTLGVGNGLIAGTGSPQPRVFLGLTYVLDRRDRDKDGVLDVFDKCPDVPEDKDGFEDKDGCPDLDNDRDTLLDAEDKCPNAAEDFDEYQDDDGCPDPDNDGDGVADNEDRCPVDKEDGKGARPRDGCPLEKTDTDGDGVVDSKDKCWNDPEDKDGFEDDDGCPEPDNDNDGVPDNFDQCPAKAEDVDNFEDEDGCPDPDNDKDGVEDKDDKCPNEPETINGFKDEDGCPDKGPASKVRVEKGMIVILDKIFFATGKSTILPKSFNLLDQVALTIKANPKFKIRIEGHTDSQGSMQMNIKLSQERADSVRTYMIKKGIDPERLISAGYGPAQPIADNKTKAGREANRRVEFHIVDEKKPEKAPEAEPVPQE